MIRFLCSLFLVLALPLAVLAQDDNVDQVNPNNFSGLVQRANEVVERKQAKTEALEQLREQLVEYRAFAHEKSKAAQQRLKPLRARMQTLGESPTDGESEAPDVAALRAEIQEQLKTTLGVVVAADDQYQQAESLIKGVDEIINERNRIALLSRGASPLNPAQWWGAIAGLFDYGFKLKEEVQSVWQNENQAKLRREIFPVSLLLFGVGLVLIIFARRLIRALMQAVSTGRRPRIAALLRFVSSLGQLVASCTGWMLIVFSIELLDLLELRGDSLIAGMYIAGFILFFSGWLLRALFQPAAGLPAFIKLDSAQFRKMRWGILSMGIFLAIGEILLAMSQNNALETDQYNILMFANICFGGFVLYGAGATIVSFVAVAKSVADNNHNNQFITRVGDLIGNFSKIAAVIGPLLGLLGYHVASQGLVVPATKSLMLIAVFYIAFRSIKSMTFDADSVAISSGAEDDKIRYGALFQVAIGFAILCMALPALALIWGLRFSELQELWILLSDGVSIGKTQISFTDILTFVLIFSIGYTITRLLQTGLRSTVLPNTRLDVGGQNAIVTGTGYVGIFLASLSAITATGLDLSNLAIVAGALSVGIGFGLQTIVSNFVSGIILLIERPIKAGDWIEVGSYSGYVRKISVRSTEVETFDRATVVIPNADLISGAVTNWTHTSMAGRVKVPVGVSYDNDPREVEKILREVAEAHPMVLLDPGPSVVFLGFGADSLDFEIRAVLRDVNWMLSAKSDMNYEIMRRFREAGIEIPYAQRDIYIKNLDQLVNAKANIAAVAPDHPVSETAMGRDTEGEV